MTDEFGTERSLWKAALKAIPSLKYALGIAGIASLISIVLRLFGFKMSLAVTVIGIVIMIFLMTLLFIFVNLVKQPKSTFDGPARVFIWFVLGMWMIATFAVFTSAFLDWPVQWKHLLTTGGKQNPSTTELAQSPTHTLLVRYLQGSLPIRIAPKDVAYILQLNPNITQWVWEVGNPEQGTITWPSDLHPQKGGPPGDFIYVCELTNHEDKTFLDVSVPFEVSFHELEMVPLTFTKDKNGKQLAGVPRPGVGHAIFVGSKDQKKIAARDGAIVKEFMHSVSLPSIPPGSTTRIYLVNQSKFISKFTFPREATAIVVGNAQRIKVALIRPRVTVADVVPWFWLPPPLTYHWKGVTGAP
jgi:hypothetical protein